MKNISKNLSYIVIDLDAKLHNSSWRWTSISPSYPCWILPHPSRTRKLILKPSYVIMASQSSALRLLLLRLTSPPSPDTDYTPVYTHPPLAMCSALHSWRMSDLYKPWHVCVPTMRSPLRPLIPFILTRHLLVLLYPVIEPHCFCWSCYVCAVVTDWKHNNMFLLAVPVTVDT